MQSDITPKTTTHQYGITSERKLNVHWTCFYPFCVGKPHFYATPSILLFIDRNMFAWFTYVSSGDKSLHKVVFNRQ